jgi:hypothetical protein
MTNRNRLAGYLLGIASASLFYLIWLTVEFELMPPRQAGIRLNLGVAIFVWAFEGMGAALILAGLPWYFVVAGHDRWQRFGLAYFSLAGAATMLVLGSCASSLSWKPLFIEDQTFLQGVVIAIERQGVCMLLTGFIFGLTYWLASGRVRHSRPAGSRAAQGQSPTAAPCTTPSTP